MRSGGLYTVNSAAFAIPGACQPKFLTPHGYLLASQCASVCSQPGYRWLPAAIAERDRAVREARRRHVPQWRGIVTFVVCRRPRADVPHPDELRTIITIRTAALAHHSSGCPAQCSIIREGACLEMFAIRSYEHCRWH
jgi:hypothetical protein